MPILDLAGNPAPGFTNFPVTNNTPPADQETGPPPDAGNIVGCSIRHLVHVPITDTPTDNAHKATGDDWFEPYIAAVNNLGTGWQMGSFEERMYEEGQFELTFPNAVGSDGTRHMNRFGLTNPTVSYFPGDEWIEIYSGNDLMFVGTPVSAELDRAKLTLRGYDPRWVLKKVREYFAGYWTHAPRDVWEHYTQIWKMWFADDFSSNAMFPDSSSGGLNTTADGRFRYEWVKRIPDGKIRIQPNADALVGRVLVGAPGLFPVGQTVSAPHSFWQIRAQISRNRFGDEASKRGGDNAYVRVGVHRADTNTDYVYIELKERDSYVAGPDSAPGTSSTIRRVNVRAPTEPGNYEVIVEGRERWVFFFLNQALVGCMPMPSGSVNCVPFIALRTGDSSHVQYADVDNISLRRTFPFLMRGTGHKGHYHLPGQLPASGLHGLYYDNTQIHLDGTYSTQVFNPFYSENGAARIDKQLNFKASEGYTTKPKAKWQPAGLTTTDMWWSVRWSGAIYLALAQHDYRIQYTTLNEGARLWLGKTRLNEQLLDNWYTNLGVTQTSGSIRAHIGAEFGTGKYYDGWYPIVIEYGQRGVPGAEFVLLLAEGAGAFTIVPQSKLSPIGVIRDQYRAESHFEALRSIAETYGYQDVVLPQKLESDLFPGLCLPVVKAGRDSNKVIAEIDTESFSTSINADDIAQVLLADGSGLASESAGAQLSVEAVRYDVVERQFLLISEFESFGEIGDPSQLAMRTSSLLALRAQPWEEVSAQPPARRELTDTLPLSGSIAMLNWRPGDGVRLNLPSIGVEDSSARQMLGVQRRIQPLGLGAATISFRQRPRGFGDFLRRLKKQYLSKDRNFQGQVVRTSGTPGGSPNSAAAMPKVSRVSLPANLQNAKRVIVTVVNKDDGDTPWFIYVNGRKTSLAPVTKPGRYDVSAYRDYFVDADGNEMPFMEVSFQLT